MGAVSLNVVLTVTGKDASINAGISKLVVPYLQFPKIAQKPNMSQCVSVMMASFLWMMSVCLNLNVDVLLKKVLPSLLDLNSKTAMKFVLAVMIKSILAPHELILQMNAELQKKKMKPPKLTSKPLLMKLKSKVLVFSPDSKEILLID